MKILLNFNKTNNNFVIFAENKKFYLGKYNDNQFEKIIENEKETLKNFVGHLINNEVIIDDLDKFNISIIKSKIEITDELTNTIEIKIDENKLKIFKNNCAIISGKPIEEEINDNENDEIYDNTKSFKKTMTIYINSSWIIPLILFVISFSSLQNNSYDGMFGGLMAAGDLILSIITINSITLMYELIFTIFIIRKYLKHVSKFKLFIYILIIVILPIIIFQIWAIILLPLLFLISSATTISSLNTTPQDNNIKIKNKNKRLNIIIIVLLVFAIITICYSLISYYNAKKENEEYDQKYEEEYGYCTNYITSTDKYIYCETYTHKIKQINIETKETKKYGNLLSLHFSHKLNDNFNYIYYYDLNSKSMDDLYVIDAVTGNQNKIGEFKADFTDFFQSNDGNIYYTIKSYSSNNPPTTYIYNPKKNINTKLDDTVDSIRYIDGDNYYHIYDKNLYVYNYRTKEDKLLYEEYYEYPWDKYYMDKNNGIKYLVSRYVFSITDITTNEKYLQDESKNYIDLFRDNEKIYLIYENEENRKQSISYINLSNNDYVLNDLNIEFDYEKMLIKNNYAYYIDSNTKHLYKTNLLDGTTSLIYNKEIKLLDNIDDNFLYFLDEKHNFSKININNYEYEMIDKKNGN